MHTFMKGIRPKINVIASLEFEFAYYNVRVQYIIHYAMRTLLVIALIQWNHRESFDVLYETHNLWSKSLKNNKNSFDTPHRIERGAKGLYQNHCIKLFIVSKSGFCSCKVVQKWGSFHLILVVENLPNELFKLSSNVY